MCQFLNLITDVVNEFVNDGKMFTAHDVTREVRTRTKDRVAHDDVKRDVHRMFGDGSMFSYNRNLASLPNVDPQPWVYHPVSADVSLYNGQPTNTSGPPIPVKAAIIDTIANSITDAADSDVFLLDTTNRLCVPNKLVRQLGLGKGDSINVMHPKNDNELVLTTAIQASTMTDHVLVTDYIVDAYDNVRITLATLQKGGLDGTEFEIEGDATKILVRVH